MIGVPTRDHAFLNPSGQLVVVFTDDDGARVLDVALIAAIDFEKALENPLNDGDAAAGPTARSNKLLSYCPLATRDPQSRLS